MFTSLDPAATGIKFENSITEDEEFNIMTYEYCYNGAGVAIGDVNNDGLEDIYFTGNMVPNKLYLNKGNLKFEDVTEKANVGGRSRWKTGVTMADVNGDGNLDIYVCYSGPGKDEVRRNELYINDGEAGGEPHFTESAATYGLDAVGTFSTQCAFFDMDGDGDLDCFLVNHAAVFYNAFVNTTKLRHTRHPQFGNRLYRNDDGKFVDISETAGIDGSGLNFGLSVSVSDVNGDNFPDLFVSNDYNERDFLYLNNRNGTFKEVLKNSMEHISEFSMGSNFEDINNDGKPDLVTLDMLPEDNKRQKLLRGPDTYDTYERLVDSGFHHQNMRNMLQLNMSFMQDSVPQFSEIGQLAGISHTDWSWAPLIADFDNDGWKDLYVTNGYLRDFTNLDFLKYTFAEEQAVARKNGQEINTWKLVQGLKSTKVSNYLFQNDKNLRFSDRTAEWGLKIPSVSNGASYADLDNDGDVDIVVNNSNEPAFILENNSRALTKNNYITVRLSGPAGNFFGIGAKVTVSSDSVAQFREMYTARGYQSSVPPILYFGLGTSSSAKNINVTWPDGKQQDLQKIKADTVLQLQYVNAVFKSDSAKVQTGQPSNIFGGSNILDFKNSMDNNYVDFRRQFLLPYQVSRQGPFLAKADVNGDGMEDVFIGGGYGQAGKLFLQESSGTLQPARAQPWPGVEGVQDGCMAFADVDNDGDQDLFVSKAGTQSSTLDSRYQSSIYLNEGKGNFSLAADAVPIISSNSSCVVPADFDHDGKIDFFVGGRSMPGNYPEAAESYFLKNETISSTVKFSRQPVADKMLRASTGLISSAVSADINGDGWPDLVVCGEFMPVTILINNKGTFRNATNEYGLENTSGLWNKVAVEDMDEDGDLDLVVGNLGLNSQLKASSKEPLTITYGDFDGNGILDPILSYYKQGQNFPYNALDELTEQLPFMRKKFLSYESYSNATMDKIFDTEVIKTAKTRSAQLLTTTYFENQNGHFIAHELPVEAQFSTVNGLLLEDVDGDGLRDIVCAGNFYPWRVQLGQMDASVGLVLKGDGKGNFLPLKNSFTGLRLSGDVRDLIKLGGGKNNILVATKNDDYPVTMKYKVFLKD